MVYAVLGTDPGEFVYTRQTKLCSQTWALIQLRSPSCLIPQPQKHGDSTKVIEAEPFTAIDTRIMDLAVVTSSVTNNLLSLSRQQNEQVFTVARVLFFQPPLFTHRSLT